ncbi:uncharacterized protein LOC111197442 [Astyanax mexicanus]|uniref:Proline-rich receptor-like protein kinase PERK12 n=1 Tax=Astyanax mexicanus TaxID=7994 RepID=A0A8T2KQK5_ASTMX|nr:uncharacterized protein LOC111197442 [Astyanax mexicanus]KAG9261603.1 proline-rich receptor-like protein kinase PERK12 [Astyanax mexicanus]
MEGLRAAIVLFVVAAYTTCKPMDWPHHICAITDSQESAESNESSEEGLALSQSTPQPMLLSTAAPDSVEEPEVRSEGPEVIHNTTTNQPAPPLADPTTFAPVINDLTTPPPLIPDATPGPAGPTDPSAGMPNPPAVTTPLQYTTPPITTRPQSRGDDI